ncbi:MAG: hypothetical protein HPY74_19895 [Firmicutes bacterium]|nr:hypothetical protein [Bacillota bacterium]
MDDKNLHCPLCGNKLLIGKTRTTSEVGTTDIFLSLYMYCGNSECENCGKLITTVKHKAN